MLYPASAIKNVTIEEPIFYRESKPFLFCDFEGTPGSSSLIFSGTQPVSVSNPFLLSNTYSRSGSTSLYINGSNTDPYLTIKTKNPYIRYDKFWVQFFVYTASTPAGSQYIFLGGRYTPLMVSKNVVIYRWPNLESNFGNSYDSVYPYFGTLQLNVWYKIKLEFTKSYSKLYINDILKNTNAIGSEPKTTDALADSDGQFYWSFGYNYKGYYLDDFCIWGNNEIQPS